MAHLLLGTMLNVVSDFHRFHPDIFRGEYMAHQQSDWLVFHADRLCVHEQHNLFPSGYYVFGQLQT